jgi:hypothetical protein
MIILQFIAVHMLLWTRTERIFLDTAVAMFLLLTIEMDFRFDYATLYPETPKRLKRRRRFYTRD